MEYNYIDAKVIMILTGLDFTEAQIKFAEIEAMIATAQEAMVEYRLQEAGIPEDLIEVFMEEENPLEFLEDDDRLADLQTALSSSGVLTEISSVRDETIENVITGYLADVGPEKKEELDRYLATVEKEEKALDGVVEKLSSSIAQMAPDFSEYQKAIQKATGLKYLSYEQLSELAEKGTIDGKSVSGVEPFKVQNYLPAGQSSDGAVQRHIHIVDQAQPNNTHLEQVYAPKLHLGGAKGHQNIEPE